MLTFTTRLTHTATDGLPILALTAEERTRSRRYRELEDGTPIYLNLPRGTVLRQGDVLETETGDRLQIIAKPEPVVTVTGHQALDLLRAAYHLGNRHVALEVTETYLRLSPDSVLEDMLRRMGLHLHAETAPFQPETGAYQSQAHSHAHSHSH